MVTMKGTAPARKLTKRECYAKQGIQFDGKHILSPLGWINELLKQGNVKLGKTVYTFSLLPGKAEYSAVISGEYIVAVGTCCCVCDGCYAMTGHYRQASARRSMIINTTLVNLYLDFVRRAITAQLEWIGKGECRIHAAGDFNTKNPEEYAAMWHDIVTRFPNIRFWTYTKVKRFETLFDDVKNANVVKSIVPGMGKNYGHCDYIMTLYYGLREMGKKVYICKCGIDKGQYCENCNVCAAYDYVLFLEHGTGYKPEKDPSFGKFCELVKNQ